MAYNVTKRFREIVYSGGALYTCTLKIDDEIVPISQISKITISNPIIDTSSQTFYVGSFISQKIVIKFKNLDNLNIQSNVDVSLDIGLNVDGEIVNVPIGKFVIDDLSENYQETCEITCLDYAVKMKPNIDYSPCFVEGKATIDTIFEYICTYFGVQFDENYPKTNGDIEIGTYNSAISGKKWISYISEIKGCNAKFGRDGILYLKPLKQVSNVSINALKSAKWQLGEKYQISRVVYFDAIRNFTSGTETNNTLFIRQENPFIEDQTTIDNIYEVVKDTIIWNLSTENYGDITLDPWDNITYTLGDNTYPTLMNVDLTYEMNISSKNEIKIPTKQQEITTNVVNADYLNEKTIRTELDNINSQVRIIATNSTNFQNQTQENIENINNNLNTKPSTQQVEKLIVDAVNGLTNIYTDSGGSNILRNTTFSAKEVLEEGQSFEYWYGNTIRTNNNDSVNGYSILLQNNHFYQEIEVSNDQYIFSFKYKLLNELATVYVIINGIQYNLTNTITTIFETPVFNINDNHLKVEFVSDINNACEVYDIMCNIGTVRQVYTQNPNEVATDTVNISKGITITSSTSDIKFVANNTGISTKDSQNNTLTWFTDKGLSTKEATIENEATIVGILRQRVGDQIWDSLI
ncbi:MAG: hypothetical protein PUJ51_25125 [Clostridiales bacterium]|uniref:hypothetical protein n=1 Tax=Terrisporobacter sp. TaxID=1965305 RepID=UPI002A5806C2|nr:hypothetical protein [Terrisporobacter sp.]MDD7757741.1 hypothetical protein [Clostridiales bacterium]MDY3778226.1 hypothetical protein [Candidatus Onthovivens sp.]MDY3828004.1 hypothetical protein [Clostridium sp.]MDY4136476.1 hypothetical protein [Terrisporobacter sp.]